jgi:hypothetical protein
MSKGTNLEALKKYMEEKKSRGMVFYKPKDEEQKVRILPNPEPDSMFFYESAYHVLGDTFYQCISYTGKKCPICQKARKFYNGTDEEKKQAEGIRATRQYYYNVIVRGDETTKQEEDGNTVEIPKIRVMQCGNQIHEKVINAMLSDEIGDITDVEKGFDLIVRVGKKGKWPDYKNSEVSRKSTPLFEDKAKVDYCLKHFKNPATLVKYPEATELERALEEYLSTGVVTNSFSGRTAKEDSEELPKDKVDKEELPKDSSPSKKEEAKSDSELDEFEAEFEKEFGGK